MEELFYNLKIGESSGLSDAYSDNRRVLRVPGGWVYTDYATMDGAKHCMTSCFIPLTSEQPSFISIKSE